jgi:hypothetical protein
MAGHRMPRPESDGANPHGCWGAALLNAAHLGHMMVIAHVEYSPDERCDQHFAVCSVCSAYVSMYTYVGLGRVAQWPHGNAGTLRCERPA